MPKLDDLVIPVKANAADAKSAISSIVAELDRLKTIADKVSPTLQKAMASLYAAAKSGTGLEESQKRFNEELKKSSDLSSKLAEGQSKVSQPPKAAPTVIETLVNREKNQREKQEAVDALRSKPSLTQDEASLVRKDNEAKKSLPPKSPISATESLVEREKKQREEKESIQALRVKSNLTQDEASLVRKDDEAKKKEAGRKKLEEQGGAISRKLRKAGLGGVSKGVRGLEGVGSLLGVKGGGGLGALAPVIGKLAGVAGVAVQALETLNSGMNQVAKLADIAGNSFISEHDRMGQLVNEIPIIGSAIVGFRDAVENLADSLSGSTERVRKINQQIEVEKLQAPLKAELVKLKSQQAIEVGAAQAKASALASVILPKTVNIDQTTATGKIRYEEEVSRAEVNQRAAVAQAQVQASKGALNAIQSEQNRLNSEIARGESARYRIAARGQSLKDNTDFIQPGRREAGAAFTRDDIVASNALEANKAQLIEITNAKRQAGINLAQAEYEARLKIIDAQKNELAIIDQKLQRATSSAQTIGGMEESDLRYQERLLERAKKQGDKAPAWVLNELAQGPFKREAESFLQQRGSRIIEERGLRDKGIADIPKESIQDLRKAKEDLRVDVNVQLQINEASLAQRIAEAINNSFESLIDKVIAKISYQNFEQKQRDLQRQAK